MKSIFRFFKRFIAFSLIISAFVAPLSFDYAGASAPELRATVGQNISGFSTSDVFGNAVSGSVLSQKSLNIIHFFATWSEECIIEMQYMQTALDGFSDSVNVYGLLHEDATSTPAACIELMDALGLNYTCLRADSVLSGIASEYAMIPQTFFVDSSGVVIEHYPGHFDGYEQLEALIDNQLGNPQRFHSVVFIDGLDGRVIKRTIVPHHGDAVPPVPPAHSGYEFACWDGDYTDVTEAREIVAVYIPTGSGYQMGDVDMDGAITASDALITMRFALGLSDINQGLELYGDIDGNGSVNMIDATIILRIAMSLI